jgi:hypothetical protein
MAAAKKVRKPVVRTVVCQEWLESERGWGCPTARRCT